jgi:hypothetical protein
MASGTCPTGFAEATELAGVTLVGTLAANKDVGTTGGSNTITPAGTVSAPTFTGTSFSTVINHTHAVTVSALGGATDDTSAPFPGVDASTLITTAIGGITATTANPSGGVASITPAGSNSAPAFTGTPTDNRSAYVKVIFCKRT